MQSRIIMSDAHGVCYIFILFFSLSLFRFYFFFGRALFCNANVLYLVNMAKRIFICAIDLTMDGYANVMTADRINLLNEPKPIKTTHQITAYKFNQNEQIFFSVFLLY